VSQSYELGDVVCSALGRPPRQPGVGLLPYTRRRIRRALCSDDVLQPTRPTAVPTQVGHAPGSATGRLLRRYAEDLIVGHGELKLAGTDIRVDVGPPLNDQKHRVVNRNLGRFRAATSDCGPDHISVDAEAARGPLVRSAIAVHAIVGAELTVGIEFDHARNAGRIWKRFCPCWTTVIRHRWPTKSSEFGLDASLEVDLQPASASAAIVSTAQARVAVARRGPVITVRW
jgi:hypothetical protein